MENFSGSLAKNESGWMVMYQVINSIRSLPLHPDSVLELSILSDKKMEDRIGDKVKFEKVKERTDSTNQVQAYAKLDLTEMKKKN
jgi:hypothetical protein